MDIGERPPKPEPVELRDIALGDRDETREPRLGREQIVERLVEAARPFGISEPIADRKQISFAVIERSEIRRVAPRVGAPDERVDASCQRRIRGILGCRREPGDKRHQRADKIAAVDSGHVRRPQRS